jgi:uncharacterized protein (DUF1015 family)
MADIRPFKCIRPQKELAARTAALPYDVYNRAEAKEAALKDSISFLNIDRPESNMPDDVDIYDDSVYAKAGELFNARLDDGTYLIDKEDSYYIYELIMDGRSQKGIVACASIDDYLSGKIKKHENTRADKELDRIRHVDTLSAQTGPIFLAYRSSAVIAEAIKKTMLNEKLYGFTADDGITHNVWKIEDEELTAAIRETFAKTDSIYIADGHHRAASAVKVGLKRRDEHPDYDGSEEFNYFLSVLFAEEELMIMSYNRVVKDLNGYSEEEFLAKLALCFDIKKVGKSNYQPAKKAEVGMYLNDCWYSLTAKPEIISDDPVDKLDVAILQNNVLKPLLGIDDPKTDKRIDFVGGIRGLDELVRRCNNDMKVAFSMYPTSITELFDVADAGLLMPPKSTWFEPKLRSGIFIHSFEK